MQKLIASSLATLLIVGTLPTPAIAAGHSGGLETATPIRHLVVIFQENVSFDHYFATYPYATNPPSEPAFYARPGTPSVNGLTPELLNHNPNSLTPPTMPLSRAEPSASLRTLSGSIARKPRPRIRIITTGPSRWLSMPA